MTASRQGDTVENTREEESKLEDEIVETEIDAALDKHEFPRSVKVFGVLCLVIGAVSVVGVFLVMIMAGIWFASSDDKNSFSTITLAIAGVHIALQFALAAMAVVLGERLLHNKRRRTSTLAYTMAFLQGASLICAIMLNGLNVSLIPGTVVMGFLLVLSSYADPSLQTERELQRHLQKMETRQQAESGTLGRDTTGKGYIKLNFFNLFWVFVVCSILGLLVETAYHYALFGGYQDRAGLLYGPFSPIYGCGGALMTVALNRFQKKNIVIIFLASAVIGGAFEFFVSWFMQTAFGITAWDYSGTFLSIGGRTNGFYMTMWGILGIFWVKIALPILLKLVNLIPWNWRYTVTTVCAVLMCVDCFLTLAALDCWYQRQVDTPERSAIDHFCDTYYDDDFMKDRFQTMTIDPSTAARS